MLNWFSKRTSEARNAHEIYGSIVAMTRTPGLYSGIGVEDTLEKRFELLILHMFVVLCWLNGLQGNHEKLKQALVDCFFEDIETITRQAGVGDLAVPKKMRRLAAQYTARMEAYQAAVDSKGKKPMESLLSEIFFEGDPQQREKSGALAGYLMTCEKHLAPRSLDWVLANLDSIATDEG